MGLVEAWCPALLETRSELRSLGWELFHSRGWVELQSARAAYPCIVSC